MEWKVWNNTIPIQSHCRPPSLSSISSLSIKPSNPPLANKKTETVLSSTKSPIWSSNCVKSQDSSNQTFNSSNIPTKFSEAITSRSRPSEVSGPSATGGHHHQSAEAANRIEKPAPGNIIDTPTLEGVSSFFIDIKQSKHLHHLLVSIISPTRQGIPSLTYRDCPMVTMINIIFHISSFAPLSPFSSSFST